MPTASPQPRSKLSKLRDIGWRLWDPIGLLHQDGQPAGTWDSEANQDFADEYDAYLMAAASALRRGRPAAQVIDDLVRIESDHMGLGTGPTTAARAKAVVAAILADPAIWTWPDGKGQFGQDR